MFSAKFIHNLNHENKILNFKITFNKFKFIKKKQNVVINFYTETFNPYLKSTTDSLKSP